MQLWSLHYTTDVEALERIQMRFTGMLPELEGISFKEWSDKLGLSSP